MNNFKYLLIAIAFSTMQVNAETLNEKVARNAANCLVGHMATKSDKYQSGQTAEYVFLIKDILGPEKAAELIKETMKKLDTAISMLGTSKKEEGEFLVNQYCPAVDEILRNRRKHNETLQ